MENTNENEKFYLKIQGSGDHGLHDCADAVILMHKIDNKWKEIIFSDKDNILDWFRSSPSYMGYLTIEDIISYIQKDSRGRFFSVKKITREEADQIACTNDDEDDDS